MEATFQKSIESTELYQLISDRYFFLLQKNFRIPSIIVYLLYHICLWTWAVWACDVCSLFHRESSILAKLFLERYLPKLTSGSSWLYFLAYAKTPFQFSPCCKVPPANCPRQSTAVVYLILNTLLPNSVGERNWWENVFLDQRKTVIYFTNLNVYYFGRCFTID